MVEPEMAYATLDDVMELAEGLVVDVVGRVLEKRAAELKVLERDTSKLETVKAPFPRITTTTRRRSSTDKGLPFEWGGDFGAPDETAVSEEFDRPVMRAPLPGGGQGLLHEARPDAPTWRSAWTCSRRRATARSSAAASASTTTTCCCSASRSTTCRRRRSSGTSICGASAACPHGGFGMGIERVVSWICGLEHLREAIPYPRMLYRIYPCH